MMSQRRFKKQMFEKNGEKLAEETHDLIPMHRVHWRCSRNIERCRGLCLALVTKPSSYLEKLDPRPPDIQDSAWRGTRHVGHSASKNPTFSVGFCIVGPAFVCSATAAKVLVFSKLHGSGRTAPCSKKRAAGQGPAENCYPTFA